MRRRAENTIKTPRRPKERSAADERYTPRVIIDAVRLASSPSAAANRRLGFRAKPELTPPPISTNPGTAPADSGGTMTRYEAHVCYHEAGHVVADYRYGFGIDWARVYEDGNGLTKGDHREFGAPRTIDYLFRQLIRKAAGLAAQLRYLDSMGMEEKFCDVRDEFWEQSDSKMMEGIIDGMATPNSRMAMEVNCRAHQWAERMVEKDWHLVEQVAQELMREGSNYPFDATARIMKRKRFRSRRVFKVPEDQRGSQLALTMSDIRGHGEALQR